MPVYSNRFKVEVIDSNAALTRQYAEIQGAVSASSESAAAAEASAAAAEASAAAAEAYAGRVFDDIAQLLADTRDWPVGTILSTRGGLAYEVVAPGTANPHHTTAGGELLLEAGSSYTTVDRLQEAITRAAIADGQFASAQGFGYQVVGGAAKRLTSPLNLYVGAFFHHQDDASTRFFVSSDGVTLTRLNREAIARGSDTSSILSSRDPALFWDRVRGQWLMPVTNGSSGVYDTTIFFSNDLLEWSFVRVNLGPTPVFGTTLPGGVSAADMIWAPQLFEDDDGTLYMHISCRYGYDYTDAFGATSPTMRPFISRCNNRTNLTFDPVEPLEYAASHPLANTRQYVTGQGIVWPTVPLRHQIAVGGATGAGFHGLDIEFARRFADDYPEDQIVYVPCAKGSAGFSNSEWTAGGAAYTEAVARINSAISVTGLPVRRIIWQGGEADRNYASFQTQLVSLFTRLRSDIPSLSSVPVSLGQIGTWANTGSVDINAAITAASASISGSAVVSSTGLTDKGDSLHFDAASLALLGGRHYNTPSPPAGGGLVIILGQSNAHGWANWPRAWEVGASIDADVIKVGSTYWMCLKDSAARQIIIQSGPTAEGPWTYNQTLSTADSLEAPSWGVHRYLQTNGIPAEKYRVYADNNRTSANQIKGRLVYFEASTPGGTYSAMLEAKSRHSMRHGSLVNIGAERDPRALQSLITAIPAFSGDGGSGIAASVLLPNGASDLLPQQDFLYYVDGIGTDAQVTIQAKIADRFFIGCLSLYLATGVNVIGNSISRPATIGYASPLGMTIVEMRWSESAGRYIPVGNGAVGPRFKATKSATQSISAATETKVTFPSELWDAGGAYDAGASRWTPTRGISTMRAVVTFQAGVSGATYKLSIKRNGSTEIAGAWTHAAGTGIVTAQVQVTTDSGATDYYEVYVTASSAGTISNTGAYTFFEGTS